MKTIDWGLKFYQMMAETLQVVVEIHQVVVEIHRLEFICWNSLKAFSTTENFKFAVAPGV